MRTSFDAIVIGSGAGGAPIASVLARAGKSVLVLDKGPLLLTQDQSPAGVSDFKRDEYFATGAEKIIKIPGVTNTNESFFTSHVEPDLNDEPHVYEHAPGDDRITIEGYTCQVVGGGTQLYGAVSLRYSELDFELQSFNEGRNDIREDPQDDIKREARDWPIAYRDLEPYYTRAEKLLGHNGWAMNQLKTYRPDTVMFSEDNYQNPLEPNPISSFAKAGMDILGEELTVDGTSIKPYRTPLAVITEDHEPSGRKAFDPRSGFVNRYGDPLGLKSSTWVALLYPISDLPNFEIRPNCIVTHLVCQGNRIAKVVYRDPTGQRREVDGKVIIVACSAIESVRLLQLSAREDSEFDRRIHQNDLLGKYFMTHCFGGAETVMPKRCDKSISLDSDWAIDCCATEKFIRENGLWAGGAIYNNTSDQALPISMARTHGAQDLDTIWRAFIKDTRLTGDELLKWFDDNFGNRLSVSFMANQVPLKTNRIELHPAIKDKWNRSVAYIRKNWHSHDVYLMNVLAEQCAKILRYGGDPVRRNWPVEGFGAVFMAENARARIANHILGGARFGTDPQDSVLDSNCRAWEFDNLYVTDGAFMPTSGGANPTLTIEANSFRVADHLLTRL